MAAPPPPQGSLRQRNVGSKKTPGDSPGFAPEDELGKLPKAAMRKTAAGGERDHMASLTLITILAFVTRFWGISHPDEVVFDEVHFGKVRLRGQVLVLLTADC